MREKKGRWGDVCSVKVTVKKENLGKEDKSNIQEITITPTHR